MIIVIIDHVPLWCQRTIPPASQLDTTLSPHPPNLPILPQLFLFRTQTCPPDSCWSMTDHYCHFSLVTRHRWTTHMMTGVAANLHFDTVPISSDCASHFLNPLHWPLNSRLGMLLCCPSLVKSFVCNFAILKILNSYPINYWYLLNFIFTRSPAESSSEFPSNIQFSDITGQNNWI